MARAIGNFADSVRRVEIEQDHVGRDHRAGGHYRGAGDRLRFRIRRNADVVALNVEYGLLKNQRAAGLGIMRTKISLGE